MELKKGQNMIEHEKEIFARPARTWFQTAKEKQTASGKSSIINITDRPKRRRKDLSKQQYETASNSAKQKGKQPADAVKVYLSFYSQCSRGPDTLPLR